MSKPTTINVEFHGLVFERRIGRVRVTDTKTGMCATSRRHMSVAKNERRAMEALAKMLKDRATSRYPWSDESSSLADGGH